MVPIMQVKTWRLLRFCVALLHLRFASPARAILSLKRVLAPPPQCARRARPVVALAAGVRAEAVVIGREEYLDRFPKALVLAE